jgi:hypothetical protein
MTVEEFASTVAGNLNHEIVKLNKRISNNNNEIDSIRNVIDIAILSTLVSVTEAIINAAKHVNDNEQIKNI